MYELTVQVIMKKKRPSPGAKKKFIGENTLVSCHYDLTGTMVKEIDKYSKELKIKKTDFVRGAIRHYIDTEAYNIENTTKTTITIKDIDRIKEFVSATEVTIDEDLYYKQKLNRMVKQYIDNEGDAEYQIVVLRSISEHLKPMYPYLKDSREFRNIYKKILHFLGEITQP